LGVAVGIGVGVSVEVGVGVGAEFAVATRASRLAARITRHRLMSKALIRDALIGSLLHPHPRSRTP